MASFPVQLVLSWLSVGGVVADLTAATALTNEPSAVAQAGPSAGGGTAPVRSAVLRREPRGAALLIRPLDRSDDEPAEPAGANMVEEVAVSNRENETSHSNARSSSDSDVYCDEGAVNEDPLDVGAEAIRRTEAGDELSHRAETTQIQSLLVDPDGPGAHRHHHQAAAPKHQAAPPKATAPEAWRSHTDSEAFEDFQNQGKGVLRSGIISDSHIIDTTKGKLSRGVYFDPALIPKKPCKQAVKADSLVGK